ncbi:MAG: hypothetical protein M1281_06660 [Chloroflexi bacterium]|nr:hypothetical protein [Chloroflexota bacterium]
MDGCNRSSSKLASHLLRVLCISALLSTAACIPFLQNNPSQVSTSTPTSTTPAAAKSTPASKPAGKQLEVIFNLSVPENTPSGAEIDLNILDEVSGLVANLQTVPMQAIDAQHYQLKLPVTPGSILKYRYSRKSTSPVLEASTTGKPVRYRLCFADVPQIVEDSVSAWGDLPSSAKTGTIQGQILDRVSGAAIPNLMVEAAGIQTLTASDGSFYLNGIPQGTHNLVAYDLDGAYRPFQQGARVASGMVTPAVIHLDPAPVVKISFVVKVPQENVIGFPLRMAGNLYSLGNTFADLGGGLNSVASRMPLLNRTADGKYELTLSLHAGTDLRYKYTLGDGYWNAELTQDGQSNLRQLIVPDQDAVIHDEVASWRPAQSEPVSFEVLTPASTLPGEMISLQMNLFGWTEPIPMWSLGDNHWFYILYNPTVNVDQFNYRFCRNDQCGDAPDSVIAGPANQTKLSFSPGLTTQGYKLQISAWEGWQPPSSPTTVPAVQVEHRGTGFTAGVEFLPEYRPSWQPYLDPVYQDLAKMGANWVFLTPTWTYTQKDVPQLEPFPGKDPLWPDLTSTIGLARGRSLKVALFPSANFNFDPGTWWSGHDSAWWQTWFERYRVFALNFADLANQTGASALVLGGEWFDPALPSGTLANGAASGVPADAETRWRSLIQEVRNRFKGQLMWALPASQLQSPPAFLDDFDEIYLLVTPATSGISAQSGVDAETELANFLDERVSPLQEQANLPLILGADFPSTNGASVDLQAQADLYNALLSAVNSRSNVAGVVSRGYYPPVALQDQTSSIHGKPAADVLGYWFLKMKASQP